MGHSSSGHHQSLFVIPCRTNYDIALFAALRYDAQQIIRAKITLWMGINARIRRVLCVAVIAIVVTVSSSSSRRCESDT